MILILLTKYVLYAIIIAMIVKIQPHIVLNVKEKIEMENANVYQATMMMNTNLKIA